MNTIWIPATNPDSFALAVHGGAGARPQLLQEPELHHRAIAESLSRGRDILTAGGTATDAVCAAVTVLEDSPLFNAAHGAALAADGTAELDAVTMDGFGATGGVISTRIARNPILLARAVMENTPHLLMVDPRRDLLSEWGVDIVDPSYFVTERRLLELEEAQAASLPATVHGTVGAVARDLNGVIAAATSTGGMNNQLPGRVGDTPIIGAGTYADNSTAAISCTGQGEHFIRVVAAHDLHARLKYQGQSLSQAAKAVLDGIGAAGGEGGLIAIDRFGNTVLAYNSSEMFYGYIENGELVTNV